MGQNLSTLARPSIVLPTSYLSELGGDLEYDKSLSSSRFLKTIKGRHRSGALVIKVFLKPDTSLSLRTLVRKLKSEKEELALIPNVLPYDRILETEKAGYLIRSWKHISLYDRISTRPFLKEVEKKWIVFQLLTALRDCREAKISHGDIKSENILLTTSLHLYLSDFAPFKPTYLPIDNPSDFSYFFDTSSRRACYIAPERFYAAGSEVAKKKAELEMGKRDGKVTEAMDVFSAGCVVMEL
ncbi:kinase-like protein, partial [Atractiella rhizophila]